LAFLMATIKPLHELEASQARQSPPIVLKEVYEQRFDAADQARKDAIWREVGRVVDIACDLGYFIRNVKAAERWATDIRDVGAALPSDVHFIRASGLDLEDVLPNEAFDLAFFSNYLEHLASTEAVLEQLRVAHRLLKPGGRVLILQPNIRLVGGAYWDFIDHQTALTDKSLAEAATMAGFTTRQVIARFLPYTTKSRMPQHPLLVRAYLKFQPAWLFMGKQTLYLGEKRV
jgi:SAM-dependent methyltransferase